LLIALYHFYILIISGICAGLGFGALVPTLMALVADKTKPQERGIALGFLTSFLDLGISAGAVVLGFAGEYWGYPTLFGVGGLFAIGGILVVVFNVTIKPMSHKWNGG
jgi:MFS family permease